jgi:hypothetical protein
VASNLNFTVTLQSGTRYSENSVIGISYGSGIVSVYVFTSF